MNNNSMRKMRAFVAFNKLYLHRTESLIVWDTSPITSNGMAAINQYHVIYLSGSSIRRLPAIRHAVRYDTTVRKKPATQTPIAT